MYFFSAKWIGNWHIFCFGVWVKLTAKNLLGNLSSLKKWSHEYHRSMSSKMSFHIWVILEKKPWKMWLRLFILWVSVSKDCFPFCRNHHLVGSRTRRSLAESNSTCINIKSNILNNNFTTIEAGNNHTNNSTTTSNNNNNNEEEHPPMIGVPNLKVRSQKNTWIFKSSQGPFQSKLASSLTAFQASTLTIFLLIMQRGAQQILSSRLPFFQLDFFPGYPSNGNEFKRPVFSLTFIVDTCAFLSIIQQGHFGCQQIFSKTKKFFKVEGENEEVKKMMLYGHTQLPSFKVWGQQEKVALSKYDLRPWNQSWHACKKVEEMLRVEWRMEK